MLDVWEKWVNRNIFRVTSDEYLEDIKTNGLDPNRDPFEGMYEHIDKLFKIMLKLENKDIIYEEKWRDGPAKASDIIEFNKPSRENKYIDFVADYNQALKFCEKWKGGALTNVVFNFTNFLKNKELTTEEKELVTKLLKWAEKKRRFSNRIIAVKGSNKIFENAKMLCLPKGKNFLIQSPYGSLENFKKNYQAEILPFLTTQELSYLRVEEKIPAEAIDLVL